MKILINGNTLGELMLCKKEAKELHLTRNDINALDKVLMHIKKNKYLYAKLVILIAITIDKSTLTSLAKTNDFSKSIQKMSDTIIDSLILIAKFGSMGMGIKEMIVTMINGANLREATLSGLQYWLGYIFLQLYPYLFDMVEDMNL